MKKRIFAILLSALMLIGCIPTAIFADSTSSEPVTPVAITPSYEWYGDGSASEFTITTVEDLAGLAKLTKGAVTDVTAAAVNFLGKTVTLGDNITFAYNQYWYYNDGTTVIDNRITGNFAGAFNGDNKTITGLKFYNSVIDKNENMYLFNSITANGSIQNLTLDTVTANINGYDHFGFVAKNLYGTASNCHVRNVTANVAVDNNGKGYISTSGAMFGSVSSAMIMGCTATTVRFTCMGSDNMDLTGALIGYAGGAAEKHTTISGCSVTDVTFDCTRKTKRSGGFIGATDNTDVVDCTATNVNICVDTYYQSIGGFVGRIGSNSSYTNCKVIGFSMDGNNENSDYSRYTGDVGGFSGVASGSNMMLSQCYVTGLDMELTLDDNMYYSVGGLIGWLEASNIEIDTCSVSGTIIAVGDGASKSDPVGGFIGVINTASTTVKVNSCTANTAVTAPGNAGGFVGSGQGGDFTECEANGSVTSTTGTAGGFIGVGSGGEFEGCTVTGNVTSKNSVAGSFMGEISSNSSGSVTIKDCESTGTVSGTNDAEDNFVGAMPDGVSYNYNDGAFEEINLSLGEDISANYYVNSTYVNAQIRFTINDYIMTVNGELVGGQYKFVFTGVAPQWIGDNIKAELIVDGEVVAIKNYSVLAYLTALKAETAETLGYTEEKYNAMLDLIDSLLVYGGTAQTYLGYKTDALVSNVVPTATNIPNNKAYTNGDTVQFTGATVYFNNTIRLMFRFKAENIDGLTFELDGNAVNYVESGEYYVITTEAIKATDFGKTYTLKAYVNGVEDATLTYSVNSYAYSMQSSSNANMKALATALYNYGDAATAYVNAQ